MYDIHYSFSNLKIKLKKLSYRSQMFLITILQIECISFNKYIYLFIQFYEIIKL